MWPGLSAPQQQPQRCSSDEAYAAHGPHKHRQAHEDRARLLATISTLRARNEALTAERDAAIADRRRHFLAAADATVRAKSLERKNERHVAALQEIGKGVEADQATIARLTAERDNALADADNDRSLAASRQREVARLSEELAQADAFVALNCDHHGQVWTRQVMGIAEREDMITRHRARHDTEGR